MYAGNTEILAGNSELAQTYRVQIMTFHIKPRWACLFPLKVKQKCMYRKQHQTENDQLLIN